LNEFYSDVYRRLYHASEGPDEEFFSDQFRRGEKLANRISHLAPPNSRVLEIGCGAGGIVSAFTNNGYNTSGIDFDERFLEFGRQRRLDLRGDTLEEWSENVDVVVLSHVLEHLTNPRDFLEKIHGILKEQGLLVIEVPNVYSIGRTYGGSFRTYIQFAHVFHFDRWSLDKILGASGFKRIKADRLTIGVYQRSSIFPTGAPHISKTRRSWRMTVFMTHLLAVRALSLVLIPALKLVQLILSVRRQTRQNFFY